MIDVLKETPVGLAEVAKRLGVGIATVRGWARGRGSRRLETAKAGGKRITTLEALQRFIQQETANPPQSASIAALHRRRLSGGSSDAAIRALRERHGLRG